MKPPDPVRTYLSKIGKSGGKKGGKSTSPAKIAAAKANGAKNKPRPNRKKKGEGKP
jgi:hypothetical protein